MIISLNEVETVCYRAALGAGLSYGLAQDAAVIGVKLIASRADGPAILLRALHFAESHPMTPPVFVADDTAWHSRGGVLPSLIAGPIAADLRRANPARRINIEATDEPAIIALCLEDCPLVPPRAPLEISSTHWRQLQKFAARTYVPASEAPRRKGAGASLLDDD